MGTIKAKDGASIAWAKEVLKAQTAEEVVIDLNESVARNCRPAKRGQSRMCVCEWINQSLHAKDKNKLYC